MFRRRKKQTQKQGPQPFTYIHQGTSIKGEVVASGRVRIHGSIKGNVVVDGVLEVAETGVIEGGLVKAGEIRILGCVRANVEASGKIEIWKKGELEGNVRAKALDIEEGATFSGRSEMISGKPHSLQSIPEVKGEAVAPLKAGEETLA